MAIAIKVLGFGQLTSTSLADLLVVSPVPNGKAQIVKAMRFVNTSSSSSILVNVVLTRAGTDRQLSPKNLGVAPGAMYLDDIEITLEASDKLRGSLSTA